MINKYLLIAIVLLNLTFCKAQMPPGQYTTTNKKIIAYFQAAIKDFEAGKDSDALANIDKALAKDSNFIEAHLLLAEYYEKNNNADKAIHEYKTVLSISPTFDKKSFYSLANLQYEKGQYENAKNNYESYLKFPNVNPNFADVARYNLNNCIFSINAIKNPVPFEPKNLGDGINSPFDEYFPAITADEKTFLYTRNNRTQTIPMQEDFLISYKVDGKWQKAALITGNINTGGNEGAPSLSADGQILFYVACAEIDGSYGAGRKGYGSCDIFYTQKNGNKWGPTFNLARPINTPYYETQPSYSADGKTLYFVSRRPGGFGSTDIYVSTLSDDNYWSEPVNLGAKVNTLGKEESVFIHPDGKTLYFASDGHAGLGGLDLFVSHLDENGKWGEPINLGYPINTYGDENSLIVGATGSIAYFASSRKGGYGGLDLYQFELPESVRPNTVTYVNGKVYDAKTKAPVGARFELIDLETAKQVVVSTANSGNGEFLVTLPINKNYALNVSQPGYLFYSENFSLKEVKEKNKPFIMDVPLLSLDTGSVVELKNIFFETAKFDLKPESKVELDKLVAFLNTNKTLRIELGGHTDNVGDKKMNITLSQNRAKSVFDYLVTNGIDVKRLSYKGYGDTKPKVANDSDEHRAINRRTEFKVTRK
jgi:outer membrane protein OmpA-like peptidoglycan-associated protein/tetratricopeptide (TPR) repeat protein